MRHRRARRRIPDSTEDQPQRHARKPDNADSAAPAVHSLLALQRIAGNQAVGRLLAKHRDHAAEHKPDVEEEDPIAMQKRKGAGGSIQRRPAAVIVQRDPKDELKSMMAPPYAPASMMPEFILDKPKPKRSNTDSSTTLPATPTIEGQVAFDAPANAFRYQVTAIKSKGTIQIVYYSEDHYPAPTPADDSGALSNVTKDNWRAIVKDLTKNRIGIAKNWSAYLAEDLHENYHWVDEWQKKITPKFAEAQNEIATLKSLATAKDAEPADAAKVLIPQANAIFKTKIQEGRKAFNDLGDDPGDPPYIAQAPAIDALIKRVQEHAKAQGWDK
jgi:hypothetical protein